MERLRASDLRALLTSIERLAAADDPAVFPDVALSAAEGLVPCDLIGYNEVDVERGQAIGIGHPSEAFFDGAPRILGEHAAEHPLICYYERTGDGSPVRLSDFLSQRELHNLGLYQELFRPLGVEHQVALGITASPIVAGVALARHSLDFSERDRALLDALRPHFRRAYRTARIVGALGGALDRDGRGAILVSRAGEIEAATEQARRWLAAYGVAPAGAVLPEPVAAWLAHQQSFRRAVDDAPPVFSPLVLEREHGRLVLHFVPGPGLERPDLVLLEERTAASRLTAREAELLELLAAGQSNGAIAASLSVSLRTVHAHLRAVYRKLGVSNRTAAARFASPGG